MFGHRVGIQKMILLEIWTEKDTTIIIKEEEEAI